MMPLLRARSRATSRDPRYPIAICHNMRAGKDFTTPLWRDADATQRRRALRSIRDALYRRYVGRRAILRAMLRS